MKIEIAFQPKQIEAAEYWNDNTTEEILFGGAKGGTKSFTGSALIFIDALLYPGTYYFIARQNLNDLTKYTTASITEVFSFMHIPFEKYVNYNGQNSYFELYNGSKVFYIDCKYAPSDPEYHRFGSLQFTRGWFEEIGQIASLAIINLSASVGRWKNSNYNLKRKILFTCNPYKGYGYNNFYLPSKNGSLPEYRKFISSLPTDNKYLTNDYLNMLDRLPSAERERLKMGNWEYDNDPSVLIDFETINNMFSNIYVNGGKKKIVADIARYGSDRAIITVWDGYVLVDYVIFNISSTVEIKNAINTLRIKYKVQLSDIVCDEDGVGGGIVDELRCQGFLNNSTPENKHYQNLKSECGYKLAEKASNIWIKCGLPEKEVEMIKQELGMLKTFDTDKDGKLRILPKEKIKEHIGRSPDWLDIFIMRMYWDVVNVSNGKQRWHM
jgi:hypothetical protein